MHPTMPRALRRAIQKGYPSFTYTTPTAEADQVDLLAATPIINQNGGSVDFKMQHALTKVVFNVKSNDDITGKVITAFSITGAKSGTLAFHVPANDDDKGYGYCRNIYRYHKIPVRTG